MHRTLEATLNERNWHLNLNVWSVLRWKGNRTPIEHVDTLSYLGVIFKYNNTFQAAMKKNFEKIWKALFKLKVRFCEIDLERDTKNIFLTWCSSSFYCLAVKYGDTRTLNRVMFSIEIFFRSLLCVQKVPLENDVWGVRATRTQTQNLDEKLFFHWKCFTNSMFLLILSNKYENEWRKNECEKIYC